MSALAVSNVVLWCVVVALILVIVALARQVGVLHERISPVGALMLNRGLKVGEAAPQLTVVDLKQQSIQIGGTRSDDRSTLLLFVSPTCPVCQSLLPVVKASSRSERLWLDVVLASDGDMAEQQAYAARSGLTDLSYVVSAQLGMTYQVSRLPFAALIDEQGLLRARGLVNSREHLESLFEAKRLGVASMQEYFAGKAEVA
jgi:methylamine dehydrogenase accessory protein MauD